MSWENIGTWLGALGSLATIIGVAYQLKTGVSFGRKNTIRSMLMFHHKVYLYYKKINEEVNNEFEGFVPSEGWSCKSLRAFLPVWLIVAFLVALIAIIAKPDISSEAAIIGILASSVITPIFSIKKVPGRVGVAFVNVSIPVSILGLLVILEGKMKQGNPIIYFLFIFSLETLWLLMVSRGSLIVKGRELDILRNDDSIKRSTFGLLFTFIMSGLIVFMWLILFSEKYPLWINLANLAVILIWIIILGYVISDVKETAVRLLWKARIINFKDNLPHLIVKTKTGNIYYGQLYDPLDSKVLVLRKSKLMHSEQITEESNLITKIPEEGGYWNILWNDIESIKIVEKGLYYPVISNDNTSLTQSISSSRGLVQVCVGSLRCLSKNKGWTVVAGGVSIAIWWTLKVKISDKISLLARSIYNLTVKTFNSIVNTVNSIVNQLQKEALGIISSVVSFILIFFMVGIILVYLLRKRKKC